MCYLRLPSTRRYDTDDSALPSTRCASEVRRGEARVYLSPLFVESMHDASGVRGQAVQQQQQNPTASIMYGRLARAHIHTPLVS